MRVNMLMMKKKLLYTDMMLVCMSTLSVVCLPVLVETQDD